VATSVLVYGEAVEHFKTQPDFPRNREGLRTLLQTVTPLRLTYPVMGRYAHIQLALCPRRALIGDVDTLLAATALEHGLTLVTLDGDFARVPSLALMRLDRAALL
jgi:predicted nucleic acid-binding protein